MKTLYPQLLLYKHTLEGIVKLVLERIALGDPPFMATIKGNRLETRGGVASVDLRHELAVVEEFARAEFGLARETHQWKDIRKHNIRNALLYKYINKLDISAGEKQRQLLKLHLLLSEKKAPPLSIELDSSFNISSITIPN